MFYANRSASVPGLNLGSDRVIAPSVIRFTDGLWWLKNARGNDDRLYFVASPDLVNLTSRGNAIPPVKGEGPKVVRWRERYWLIADLWE